MSMNNKRDNIISYTMGFWWSCLGLFCDNERWLYIPYIATTSNKGKSEGMNDKARHVTCHDWMDLILLPIPIEAKAKTQSILKKVKHSGH